MQHKIKLRPNEVKDFVSAASKCAFDVDISYNRFIVDAKSIMGIFSLDLEEPLDLQVHGDIQPGLESGLAEYLSASTAN